MGKIEIDNVKMWESILGFEAEVKTEDLRNNPTSIAIKFISDAIKKALEDQSIEYKDGSLHYIGEEEVKKPEPVNFEDFPREEQLKWYICTKSIPQKDGGFMPLFCEGEHATIEKIFDMLPELKNDTTLFTEHFRKVTEVDLPKEKPSTIKFNEPDIDTQELEADKKENATKQGQHLHEEFPCLRELEFQYHTLSASLVPYKEEHYRLVDLDCASVLRLICKNLSSLQAHEVRPWIAYLVGVFEGSAMQRQQKIGQQSGNSI